MPTPAKPKRTRRPRQPRARETVDVMIRATAQILSRDGAENLTTNRIAERAGVSIGSLYEYFPNKQALVDEVRRGYDAAFQERLLALVGELWALPLRAAIERAVRVLIAVHAEDVGLHNAVSTGLAEAERRLLYDVAGSFLESRGDAVRRPNRSLAAVLALDTAEALIHGIAVRDPKRLTEEEFAAEVTGLLVRYLAR